MLKNLFPFLRWFEKYSLGNFQKDLVAGVTVALVLIPQSMAYAQLAGLPPYYGLYAAFLPPMVAALFGSSRQLATGPVAVAGGCGTCCSRICSSSLSCTGGGTGVAGSVFSCASVVGAGLPDPLDPGSLFEIVDFVSAAPDTVIHWTSREGNSYDVLAVTNLIDGITLTLGSVTAVNGLGPWQVSESGITNSIAVNVENYLIKLNP